MISADIGVSTPLELMLFDGQVTKGVRVFVRTTGGAFVAGINLTHIGEGLYTGNWIPAATGYYHANYIVYTDGTLTTEDYLYSRTTECYKVGPITTPDAIANAVWDEMLTDHLLSGSFGEAITLLLNAYDPAGIASAVWDAFVVDHRIPDTFGDWLQAIWRYSREITNEVKDPIWGLRAIKELIDYEAATINGNVLLNGSKLDALVPIIDNAKTETITAVQINTNLLTAMAIQDSADLTTILNALDVTNDKVDALAPLITSLQNNTTARFVVPERLVKPTTGTKAYQFHLRIYDTSGAPTTPDSVPTIRIRRLDTGVDIVNGAIMTLDGAKVGAYYYVYNLTATSNEFPALVEVTIVELGVTRYVPALTEITEFESDLNALLAAVAAVDVKVTATSSEITNPSYGLQAIRNGEGTILNAISAQNVTLGQIKTRTDLIPANIATVSDINDVLMQLAEKPTIDDITAELNLVRDSIKGPDGRNLTQVYNKIDFSGLVQTSDPRLNNLDVAVSTRSTLSAADVWNYGTRSLTNFHLDNLSVKAIWDYLCSQATVPGSLGKRIADMLDVAVSSRATEAAMIAALAGVAQESTLLNSTNDILNSLLDCKNKLNNLTAKTLLIKAKTDNLPSDPASQGTLETAAAQIRDDIAVVDAEVGQIKVKTDLIPSDPARQGAVLSIPTNPLLATDPRLVNLDARISTRSTLTAADLALLAKTTDVTTSTGTIISNNNTQTTLINGIGSNVAHIKTYTDRIPIDPATLTAISQAETAILEAIAHIAAGTGADPAEIWAYAHRTLTQDPASFGPDISNLATKTDVQNAAVHQYINRMTTTFSPTSGIQEVMVWAEKDGLRVATTSACTVIIKDSLGALKWSQSASTPNSDGVYRFVNPIVIGSDANYYIIVSITVDGSPRVTQQAFMTVG